MLKVRGDPGDPEVGTPATVQKYSRPHDFPTEVRAERAVGPETALLLKVHRSNFAIVGFTAEVGVADLVAIGRERSLPVAVDLGSGCLVASRDLGLRPEPTPAEYSPYDGPKTADAPARRHGPGRGSPPPSRPRGCRGPPPRATSLRCNSS